MAKITFIFEDTTVNGIPAVKADVKHDFDSEGDKQEITPAIFTAAIVVDALETLKRVQEGMFAEQKKAADMGRKSLDDILAAYRPKTNQKPN